MSIISVDGTHIKSLNDDLPAECDNSREVLVSKACISMDASEHSRGHLMYYKDIKCPMFRMMDYSEVEKKYGKEFLEELNPPNLKGIDQILPDVLETTGKGDCLKIGDRVSLTKLKSTEYNGRVGKIVSLPKLNEVVGRYGVRLEDSEGAPIAIRRENIERVKDTDPLKFDKIFCCSYLVPEKNIIYCLAEEEDNDELPTAISNHIMKEGRHYCTIKVTDNNEPCIVAGICRSMENFDPDFAFEYERKRQKEIRKRFPTYKIEETMSPLSNVSTYAQWDSKCHACAYNAATGKAMCAGWDSTKDDPNDQTNDVEFTEWKGMEILSPGSILGLLLDLDEGTLTIYKDNRRLGVMKEGLEGSFCWFVETFHYCQVEINRGQIP